MPSSKHKANAGLKWGGGVGVGGAYGGPVVAEGGQ